MDVPVQRQVRFSFQDQVPHRNTADMDIKWHMVDFLAIQVGTIEVGLIGRCVKEKDGA